VIGFVFRVPLSRSLSILHLYIYIHSHTQDLVCAHEERKDDKHHGL
jgi:hypothetical protein